MAILKKHTTALFQTVLRLAPSPFNQIELGEDTALVLGGGEGIRADKTV
jgi:hypothetical protein